MSLLEAEQTPQSFEQRVEAKLEGLSMDRLSEGVEFSGSNFDMDMHLEALLNGKPIICTPHSAELQRVNHHEVFPGKTIERSRSAHGVSFGRLTGYRPSKKREGSLMSVAYKPFSKADKAIQELYGYRILQEIGVETFDPICVIPTTDHKGYVVITRKRNDMQSLDRDEWIVGRQPRDNREVEIAHRNNITVKEIAGTLARLHTNGVFHPDGQIKNFSVNVKGTVGVIDTENLTVRSTDDLDNSALAWRDIEKLVRSLILDNNLETNSAGEDKIFGVGMLANMNLLQLRNACLELIIEPYLASLEDEIRSDGDSDYLTGLAYEIQDEFDKDANWPLNLVASTVAA